ncbi:hypothetical protein WJX81_008278 [Elliptochloris bilobata]|uniref:Rhodanese domain-containing protein n=1 Tax=Elliptochloris bilobata TaxID=381761 RepID=A0AAW1RN98_9CHLO
MPVPVPAGDSAPRPLDGAQDALASAQDAASSAAAAAAEGAAAAARAAGDAAVGVTDSTSAGVSGALEGLAGAAGGVTEAGAGLVQRFNEASGSVVGGASDAASGVADSVGGVVAEGQAAAAAAADAAAAALSQTAAAVQGGIDAGVQTAADAAGAAAAALPEPVRDALAAAAAPAAKAASQVAAAVAADPRLGAAAAAAAVGVPAVAVWRARYGGFAGVLAPQAAFEALQEEDAVLVDMRPDAARARDGVPELRFGARGKGAAVQVERLPPGLAGRVRDTKRLEYDIAAAVVAGLVKVGARTRVVVMDGGDGRAVRLARALRSVGRPRSYVLQGGFRAWQGAGLPVRAGDSYAASALDALADEAAMLQAGTSAALSGLGTPLGLAAGAGAAALAGAFVVDWHRGLQFIGALGPLATAAGRALQYDSPQDAWEGVSGLYDRIASSVSSAAAGVSQRLPSASAAAPRAGELSPADAPAGAEAGLAWPE